MRLPSLVVLVTALLALVLAGCGSSSSSSVAGTRSTAAPATTVDPQAPEVNPAGDIPDNQAFVAYRPPGAGYSVKVPEGWARTSGPGGAVAFTDKLNRIELQAVPAAAVPTVASVKRSELPKLAASVRGFAGARVSTVRRTAGPAVRVTYTASSAADAVTGRTHTDAVERYVFHHGGKDVILTLSGPVGADNVDPWKIVTDSLRYGA